MILKDRVAIVTAAGSGIGRGGAEIMGREGAIVIATDLVAERAEETARQIRESGGRAEGRPLDVTRDEDIQRLVDHVAGSYGRIDILHNHAGIQVEGTLEQVPVSGLDASYNVNVRAHFVAAKALLPHMKRQGKGVIINTSSNSGVFFDKGKTMPARLYALIGGPEVTQAPQAEELLDEIAKAAHGFKAGNLTAAAAALAAARNLGQGLGLDPLFDHMTNMLDAAESKARATAAQ